MENVSENEVSVIAALLRGLLLAALILLLLSAAVSAVIYLTPLSDQSLPQLGLLLDAAALFAAAWTAARAHGRRGLLLGLAVAAAALLIMLPLGGGLQPGLQAAICLLAAMAGGVLGVR